MTRCPLAVSAERRRIEISNSFIANFLLRGSNTFAFSLAKSFVRSKILHRLFLYEIAARYARKLLHST